LFLKHFTVGDQNNDMSNYVNYLAMDDTYGYFWIKYRPVVLKLMIDSAEIPQQYKFSAHEVKAANARGNGRFSFVLKVHKSKAVNDIRTSLIAKDLVRVLQNSKKASELTGSALYEFTFDKHFVLHVVRSEFPVVQPQTMEDRSTELVKQ
jgi:hypothetical protein